MTFRVRWIQKGGHIHCRVFQGLGHDHRGDLLWAKNGDLVFDEAGWDAFVILLLANGVDVLPEPELEPYALLP